MTVEESMNLAIERHQAGDLAKAQDLYRQVLMKDPKHADAWHLLGVVHYQAGDSNTARDLIKKAIVLKPVTMDYYFNLGLIYNSLGSKSEAMSAFHRAAMLPPSNPGIMARLAKALADHRQFADALSSVRQALLGSPDDPDAQVVLGKIHLEMGDFEKGLEVFGKVAKLRPGDNWIQWNDGLLLLLHGRFAEGWPKYERRIYAANGALSRPFAQQQWTGGDAAGKTLLVHAEGDEGETIQYARYVAMLKEKVARVIFECQRPLVPVMESLEGVDQIVGRETAEASPSAAEASRSAPEASRSAPEFDLHVPLQCLPGIFKTELSNVPNAVPYLKAPEERVAEWAERVSSDGLKKVGLVWSGPSDGARANRVEMFAPLAEIGGVKFFSLQIGPESVQPRPAGMDIADLTSDMRDLADVAAVISQMDLIISVDSPAAHLAGALARPVWLLAACLPPYQWMLNRTDSPWYPTMRIFRQTKYEDWAGPVGKVAAALKELK